MAALSAIRCNPDLAAKHQQLVGDGKPGKVLAAVMRKLLLLANVLLRDDRLWKPRATCSESAGAADQPDAPLSEPTVDAGGWPFGPTT